jgi:hypothetical protein
MVPRITRPQFVLVALMVLMCVSAGEAFGWGQSYYPCYQSPGYTYYYPATTYYYPAPAAGQSYTAMMPVTEAPASPVITPAPQYYAPAVGGGYYGGGYGGGYGSSNLPRTSWNFGKFPPY